MSEPNEGRNVSEAMFLEHVRKHEALEERYNALEADFKTESTIRSQNEQALHERISSVAERVEALAEEIISDLAIAETLEDIEKESIEEPEAKTDTETETGEETPPPAVEPKKRLRGWA